MPGKSLIEAKWRHIVQNKHKKLGFLLSNHLLLAKWKTSKQASIAKH